ncbi:siderophore ABC transporter permease [Marinithermofilum abyssi]|uniref:Siderophore ABC transporter permease n=1 Tax=Marinithermofilum abyssi TaxID=1571185 RepID=A0A8J2VIZ0_9BACL|nr:iron ABC transporter permease [Marinithermofilum abyssi]GGE26623.1 siderophore ABC transporter permease [Marinithermofilum abyssi]
MYRTIQPLLSRSAGLVWLIVLWAVSMIASVKLGLTHIDWHTMKDALTTEQPTKEQLVIQTTRIPRALIATFVGASLAVAGALMQALTRNPLASPGILGINAGAAFFVVLATSLFTVSSFSAMTWIAFAGAAVSGVIVFAVSSVGRGGVTPLKLTLAGAAITAFFSTLTQGLLVTDEKTLDEVLYWLAGSIAGRSLDHLWQILPFFLIAWLIALGIARHITILTMGEHVAKGLGQRTAWVKMAAALVVIFLAGGSVAVAGPIGLVGLVVPHIARSMAGNDYRWILPYCALIGASYLLLADVGARYLIMPDGPVMKWMSGLGTRVLTDEVPVGVITALIGTPFFITIARRSITH